MLPLFALLQRMAEPIPFLPPLCPPAEISSFRGISIATTASGTQEVLPTPVGRKYSPESSLLTSSPSMALAFLSFCIVLLAVATPLAFPLLPPLLLFPAPGRCFRTWVLITYQFFHLSLPVFRSNKRPPSFNFQKARWDDFALYFDSHCPSAEEYSSLFLSSAATTLHLPGTECGRIFHSFWPHQTPS